MYGARNGNNSTFYLMGIVAAIYFLMPSNFSLRMQKNDFLITIGTITAVSALKDLRF
jgi:hypothetical protein